MFHKYCFRELEERKEGNNRPSENLWDNDVHSNYSIVLMIH